MINKLRDIRATCFDFTESSSDPRVLDPFKNALHIAGLTMLTITEAKLKNQKTIQNMWK